MTDDQLIAEFEAFVRSDDFPCVGAKSALVRDHLTIVVADAIESPTSDLDIYKAVCDFGENLDLDLAVVQSLVILFRQPGDHDEAAYENHLWSRLQCLHNIDVAVGEKWDDTVSADPNAAHFSMCVGGEPYFVVGLHPNASRPARRFSRPAMVFNSHKQFEKLREEGRYQKMQQVIRVRDSAIAGDINPMLDDHGFSSEARQYSGRAVGQDWKCPFTHKEISL